jgi:2,4-dienoyl-CoA reductase-like NADH-dependent reductase (Old Yellow Enzyme family)
MLSSPFRFPCGLSVPNRITKGPMTEALAGPDCRANARHIRLYQTFAEGGAGLLVTGNVVVDSRYLETPGNVVIEDDLGLPVLKEWARAAQAGGAAVIMQLSHAGRQTPRSAAKHSVAPSAVLMTNAKFFSTPREITEPEILETIERFAYAASVAERAGFAGVEVHAANGYLLSQFLSPRVNRRTDAWGGSIENRARILVRTVARIREVVSKNFAVGVKLNVEDFIKGGLAPEDALQAIRMLTPLGVDFLELSGGTHEYAAVFELGYKEPRKSEGVFLDYALAVRKVTDIPLILTGGMRTRLGMERALTIGACDLIAMARPLALEPDLPRRMLNGQADGARNFPIKLLPPPRAALSELIWTRTQLGRMSRGRKPKPKMWVKLALIKMLLQDRSFAKRRRAYLARYPAPAFTPLPKSEPISVGPARADEVVPADMSRNAAEQRRHTAGR